MVVIDWRTLEPGSDVYLAEVLKDINAVRAEHMMEPLDELPKGHRGGGYAMCALGKAFEGHPGIARSVSSDVRVRERMSTHDVWEVPQPTLLADYEAKFELGLLPELTY